MFRTVRIRDVDRKVDYILDVKFDLHPAEPEIGIGDVYVELESAKCLEVITWLGKKYVVSDKSSEDEDLETMGDWCIAEYPEEIESAVADLVCVES